MEEVCFCRRAREEINGWSHIPCFSTWDAWRWVLMYPPFILKLPGSYFLCTQRQKKEKKLVCRLLFQTLYVCLISFLWNPCSHHFGIMCRRVAMSFLLLSLVKILYSLKDHFPKLNRTFGYILSKLIFLFSNELVYNVGYKVYVNDAN